MASLLDITLFALILGFAEIQGDDLVISLKEPNAKIRGHVLKSHLGKDYYAFQGIPYAQPPLGENRFAEPKEHPAWSGILNTTQSSKVCMQVGREDTEDCLELNVYTPVRNSSARLPVLVWIHGGAFMVGSGTFQAFNPQCFIDYDIIIVAINYRLGAFGFLTTEDGVIPGNLGLKDQVLALKWVNKNIEAFGGDPKKVTIAGQSAGSISVSYHIVSQKSTGLFRAGILESGTSLVHTAYISNARNYAFQLGRYLNKNFTSNNSTDLLNLLKKASSLDILSAAQKVEDTGKQVGILTDLIWAGVVESKNEKNAYITEPMHASYKSGQFDKVPILIGYTSEETIFFMGSTESVKSGAAELDKNPANLVHYKLNVAEKNRNIVGTNLHKLYTNTTFVDKLATYVGFSSDIGFAHPTIRGADLSSKYVPAFLYEFTYKGSTHHDPTNIPNLQGVGHSEELAYMWYATAQSESDKLTSKRLLTMWTNFVKNLNPTPAEDLALGIPIWQKVQPNNLAYMDIGSSLVIKKNPKKYVGVRDIYDQYLEPPYNIF